ncbi:T9SS type A sorting domain-containing protein [Flavobacterium praedii]|uniref:T9SS type A sorting domain-containing protein n=1 Tax=Flavobacterium praedii TaxID=3002900 RepID=UPI002481ABDE|nr:T9SS type A sorting domain-containing protein [Flavobacterium praedii]
MKTKLLILLFLASLNTYAQYTTIPDVNFEKFLINEGIDSGVADGKVLTSAISSLKTINMSGLNINDLTGIEDFVALTSLNCSYNNLTSLNVSSNIALTNLNCFTNKLTSLNVANNTALTSLNCAINAITNLNLTSNLSLTTLNCYDNKLTSLNVSNNTALTGINCSANPFANGINVTNNKALTFLNCNFSTLTTLDVSSNNLLESLNCQGNSLKTLDISANTALTFLDCSSNQLTSLNLKNGNNTNFSTFSTFKFNSGLTCIQVDNATFSTSNWASIKDATASYNTSCAVQQYTLIPDVNFENKLITLGIDSGVADGKVLTNNVNKLTSLDVSSSSITNLTGIQDFKALTTLQCNNNQLTTLDVSQNTALTYLNSYNNQLTTLNVSQNVALKTLYIGYNKLTTLDVSKNIALTTLESYNNQLTTLDVSKNVALTSLSCYSNQLKTLDVSKNVVLITLYCFSNQLTTLDVSKNVALKTFYCYNNKFTSLNLKNGKNTLLTNANIELSSNPDLKCIVVDDVAYANTNWGNKKDATAFYAPYDCSSITQIPDANFEEKLIALGVDTDGKNGVVLNTSIATLTSLDVSNAAITNLKGIEGFTALTTLNCSGNLFTKIDLSKNASITTLNCSNSPSLICIQVADVAAASNWAITKDATASLSLDCTIYALIPDSKFEDKLIALNIDRDGKNGKVATESIASLTSLDVSSSSITDLTGIQDFVSLTALKCYSNQLTALDISKNLALKYLDCYYNQLTTLDVSKNLALSSFYCDNNQLTTLDVSKNVALNYFYCSKNQLTTLDVSKNVALTGFGCYSNQLTTLDVSKNVSLINFICSSNKLTTLNLKNGKNILLKNSHISFYENPNLNCIVVDDVAYSNSNWENKDTFAFYSPYDCSTVTQIPDVKFEDKLIALGVDTDGKNGVVLNTSIATLTSLDVSNAAITNLKGIEGFTALTTLNCSGNLFTKIDLSKNASITTLNCSNSPSLICIQVADVAAASNWAITKDATASLSLDCTIYTLIPDSKFEDKLIALGIDTDGKNGKVETVRIAPLTSLDVSSSSIKDLTGIQDFITLTSLDCGSNQLKTLDVSKNVTLTYLGCYGNQLTTLDVSKNTSLTNLACSGNQLKTIDVSKNVALTSFGCAKNQLTSLDISKNIALTAFGCYYNQLTSLDVSKNTALTYLDCSDNRFQTLNLKNGKNTLLIYSNIKLYGNQNLYCILVDDVTYSNKNWGDSKDTWAKFNTECNGLTLPTNNFNVESKGETCLNSNNGEINITATATFGYKAKINAGSYTFTNNSLKVPNLAPGTYTVIITIPGETFEQSFSITIPKGATITGKSSVAANKVSIEITEGTAPYTVFVDGVEQFETTDSNFTVDAKKGGLLQVKTAKACEGIYAKDMARLNGVISAYPNPTSGSFEIELPSTKKEVVITLYTLDGQMVSTKTYTVENGKAQLTLENQPAGVYVAKIELDTPEYLKIIKN